MVSKIVSLIVFCVSIFHANQIEAQNEGIYGQLQKFSKLYYSGDLVNAEKSLLQIVDSKEVISDEYLIAAYNNLGATNSMLGRYSKALDYYNTAERLIKKQSQNQTSASLADIYNNKAIIFGFQKSFSQAIEYFDRSISIYELEQSCIDFNKISTAYLNIGIIYYEKKDYSKALNYFKKCTYLMIKNSIHDIPFAYLNIAKTYSKIDNPEKAQLYFIKRV